MSTNIHWSQNEDMKIHFEIIDRELLKRTKYKTRARKLLIDEIAKDLAKDSDFSDRVKNTKDHLDTIAQHIRIWIAYLEGRRDKKPPQKY